LRPASPLVASHLGSRARDLGTREICMVCSLCVISIVRMFFFKRIWGSVAGRGNHRASPRRARCACRPFRYDFRSTYNRPEPDPRLNVRSYRSFSRFLIHLLYEIDVP
jgi:hypothetical protein